MSFVAPFAATLIVSTLPICALFFLPRTTEKNKGATDEARASDGLLNVMLCFSAGALMGDALLHILLHSIFSQEATHDRVRHLIISLLIGFVFFFACELAVRIIHCSPESVTEESKVSEMKKETAINPKNVLNPKNGLTQRKVTSRGKKDGVDLQADSQCNHLHDRSGSHGHGHGHCHHHHGQTGGILSLFADALHNFMDGLALAVTFHQGFSIGVATAIAIFVHEVPHQIGDYAMLAKSGYSHHRAIQMQLYTALSAGLGVAFGYGVVNDVLPGSSLVHNDDILCFIAGGFIYVACVSIIPEVLVLGDNQKYSLTDSAVKLLSLIIGVGLMAIID